MIASAVKVKNTSTFICLMLSFLLLGCVQKPIAFQKIKGNVFGTTFHITYQDSLQRDFTESISDVFKAFNQSLSTYHSTSTISKLNNNLSSIQVDANFKEVFLLSKEIYKETEAYFDPTIGKMVNAWGFGPVKNKRLPTNRQVDSLMQFVGFDKVSLKGDEVLKENKNIYLDFNAIAKGFGVDVVARFLETKGISNYLVEIGGEIRAKGKNTTQKLWSVGIENPNFDGTRSLMKVTCLEDEAMATSGNYRKYKTDSITGKKIAHTLNPKTGFPAKTDLLSVSVIGKKSCASVDAYATAFMAMGYKKAKQLALQTPNIKVFFVYLENDELKTYGSKTLVFTE